MGDAIATVDKGDLAYSIEKSTEGIWFVEVDSPSGATTSDTPKDIARRLSEIVRNNFTKFVEADGQVIGINQRTAREWVSSKNAENLRKYSNQVFIDKQNAFGNADELLKAARNYIGEEAKHTRKDNFVEFARGVVDFRIEGRGYEADIIVGTTKSGVAILYDLVNIQTKKIVADTSYAAQDRRTDISTTDNSIAQPSQKINSSDEKTSKTAKDSLGNELTDAQTEYFKDSKVRDKDGNLLVMYQGTGQEFTVFDRKKSKPSNLYGRGFYFTDSESQAKLYGGARAFYLAINNPLSTTERTITRIQMRKFLKAVAENEDYSIENYGTEDIDKILASV